MWHVKSCKYEQDQGTYGVTLESETHAVSLLLQEVIPGDREHSTRGFFISSGFDPWQKETRLSGNYEHTWGERIRAHLRKDDLGHGSRDDLEHLGGWSNLTLQEVAFVILEKCETRYRT